MIIRRRRTSERIARLEKRVAQLSKNQKRLKIVAAKSDAALRLATEDARALEALMIDVNRIRRDVDSVTGASG